MSNVLGLGKDFIRLLAGSFFFKVSAKNSDYSHQALIRLYCKTKGRSQQAIVKFLSFIRKPQYLSHWQSSEFQKMDLAAVEKTVAEVKDRGYSIFPERLSEETIQSLVEFSKKNAAYLRRTDSEPMNSKTLRDFYNPENPKAVRYDYSSSDLLRCEAVQKLISDPTILQIARRYLGVEPVLDIVTMWWHTDFQKHPDSNAAQLYHFDMDRVKWLKFFFYLTDVESDTGPHCFIQKTHNAANIPQSILAKGYSRHSDAEIAAAFSAEDIKEFTGPRGLIIAEDTAGLHKGKHVENGGRLIFQLEFAVSMFGAVESERFLLKDIKWSPLKEAMADSPRIYSNLDLKSM